MFGVRLLLRTLKPRTLKLFLFFLIVLILFYNIFRIVEHQITPNILAIAETKTRILATETINQAIKDKIAKNVQYKDLISIHKNTSGQITLIQINTGEINRLEAETALETIKILRKVTLDGVNVPLGAATGSKILSNYGPLVRVALLPGGTATVNTVETFEAAGINQTRHRIGLEIIANIRIIQPLLSTDITIQTHVPIVETIIIGDVPKAILELK